jgi:hypothetical protein
VTTTTTTAAAAAAATTTTTTTTTTAAAAATTTTTITTVTSPDVALQCSVKVVLYFAIGLLLSKFKLQLADMTSNMIGNPRD